MAAIDMALLPDNLPSIQDAKFPALYIAAKEALAACSRIDECKDWADKAAALATYAKEADDSDMEKYAVRVRARAIQRCGELLRAIAAKPGQRTDLDTSLAEQGRYSAAKEAGLGPNRRDVALRIANIPGAIVDIEIESDNPPSIKKLASLDIGKGVEQNRYKSQEEILAGRDPADFQAQLHAFGRIRAFAKEIKQFDISAVMRGAYPEDFPELLTAIAGIHAWLIKLTDCIGEERHANATKHAAR